MPKKTYGKAGRSLRNFIAKKAFLFLILIIIFILIDLLYLRYSFRNPANYGWLFFLLFVFATWLKASEKKLNKELDNYEKGAKGEEKIDRILSELGKDFYVIHDVVISKGNVDHIVVAPSGIYTIETKSHHGRVTVNQDELLLNNKPLPKDFLSQAMAEALAVKEYLQKISLGKADYFVQPLLVFTNAFVEVRGKVRGVKVVPAKWLLSELQKGNEILGKLERSRITAALKEKSQSKQIQ